MKKVLAISVLIFWAILFLIIFLYKTGGLEIAFGFLCVSVIWALDTIIYDGKKPDNLDY